VAAAALPLELPLLPALLLLLLLLLLLPPPPLLPLHCAASTTLPLSCCHQAPVAEA
jgi:hypothetical protein